VFNVGGAELLIFLVVALMVLGPNRLPQAARQIGKALAQFRNATSGVRKELEDSMAVDDLRREVADLKSSFDIRRIMSDDDSYRDKPVSPGAPINVSGVAAPDGDAPVLNPVTPPTVVSSPDPSAVRDILAD
jgi:sec-independent protein translocase protein TatB